MKSKKETFESLMQSFAYRYDLRTVFDDFLTMSICAMSQNPLTKKSHDEDLYLATIGKYKNDDLRFVFPKLYAALIVEMEEQLDSGTGIDVLGRFYEANFYRKGASQYFTPWPVCEFMARCMVGNEEKESGKRLRILDSSCGSGRLLLAAAKSIGREQGYYGIDIDHMCVKMTAINLFLNGNFHTEVMWADALDLNDFKVSYVTSFLPFGIFRITDKEKSSLWHSQQALKREATYKPNTNDIQLSSINGQGEVLGSQLNLF